MKLFESAPTINNDREYWLRKGKIGKECMIFFHDDLDGIMSAIVTRQYLINKKFKIAGYGVINYQVGWKGIELNDDYINIALDYAEDNEDLDIYIDHHGKFIENGGDINRFSVKSHKMSTSSAYEAICLQLGIPTDSLILSVIDMVDSAKYQFYDVDIETILNFNLDDILESNNPKMVFAGAFNQLIKRGDYKTLIEVAHNASLSVYNIYTMFKILYPGNNITRGGEEKDFLEDGRDRLGKMENRVRGKNPKKIYLSQDDFFNDFWDGTKIKRDGYQIIGKLIFVPNGTWANALRARAILMHDLRNNPYLRNHKIYFVLLQYGASLQVADTTSIKDIPEKDIPVLRNGEKITDLGKYTNDLLKSINYILHYNKSITKSGGHFGIGNLTNVLGVKNNVKWVDIFKNKIINDLSGVKWSVYMPWDIPKENPPTIHKINEKILMIDEIRKIR